MIPAVANPVEFAMNVVLLSLLLAGPMASAADPASPAPAAQAVIRNVPVGDPLRRVLLDTLRPAIENDLGQPVQFMVDTLRVEDGNWAFFAGRSQQPNGRPIDFSRTHYKEAMDEGMFDGPATTALFSYNNGEWRVVYFAVGPTDVPYVGWQDEFSLPQGLFE